MSKKPTILTNSEIASFCRQTSILIKAGITPAEGMDILREDTISEEGKALLSKISESCSRGLNFHQALEETNVFPQYVTRLISLGEESGNTDTVLDSLADYYEREDEMSETIRSAVSYPLIMIAMMFFIVIVLIVKVLPIFKQVFAQLGAEMDPFAEKLMNIGSVLSKYALGFTIVLCILVILGIILVKNDSVRHRIHDFLTSFPPTAEFYLNIARARFASGLYLAFSSGMDIFHALDMVEELVENKDMEAKIKLLREDMSNHDNMAEAIANANIFSNLYTRMIAVAFKAGDAEQAMKYIALHYEDATEKHLRKMVSIIEPTLVIILSLIVGIILLSVLLPLMGIMSSIG